jgi:hypothetical protein
LQHQPFVPFNIEAASIGRTIIKVHAAATGALKETGAWGQAPIAFARHGRPTPVNE